MQQKQNEKVMVLELKSKHCDNELNSINSFTITEIAHDFRMTACGLNSLLYQLGI